MAQNHRRKLLIPFRVNREQFVPGVLVFLLGGLLVSPRLEVSRGSSLQLIVSFLWISLESNLSAGRQYSVRPSRCLTKSTLSTAYRSQRQRRSRFTHAKRNRRHVCSSSTVQPLHKPTTSSSWLHFCKSVRVILSRYRRVLSNPQ